MKKLALLLFLLLTVSFTWAQEIIENPQKPLRKNAGRILKLEEEIKISDENGDFFFRYPDNVRLNKEGYIFISDYVGGNFLKFSPEGKFLKNMFKKGEGPGELQDMFSFEISQNKIFIYDFTKSKIIITNQDGDLVGEYSKDIEFYHDFYGIYRDWLVFKKKITPQFSVRKTSQLYQDKHTIVLLSKDGTTKKDNYIFPNESFYIPSSLGGGGMSWDPFTVVLDENIGYLYVSSSREYLIHVLDIDNGIVIRSFRRKYNRISYEMSKREEEFIKKVNAPKKKYANDIKNIFLVQNFIWVETSTIDDVKGVMIDVFNQEGKFIDNFFLNLKGELVTVHNNSIFVKETDKDENTVIKKYKIVE